MRLQIANQGDSIDLHTTAIEKHNKRVAHGEGREVSQCSAKTHLASCFVAFTVFSIMQKHVYIQQ